MSKITTSIGHLKTFLLELEEHATKLEAGARSSAPKARAFAQKMKVILGDLRKDLQEQSTSIPTKPRTAKAGKIMVTPVESSEEENDQPTAVEVIASVMTDDEMPEHPPVLKRSKECAKS